MTNGSFLFRKATESDIPVIKAVLDEAREAQRSNGFRQWKDGYPSEQIITADIKTGQGYLLEQDGIIAAYADIAFTDPEYDRLEHIWNLHTSYGAIHRIGIADRFRGRRVSYILLRNCEKLIAASGAKAIRIDTGVENRPMQHLLSRTGYTNLGQHRFIWGERIALEKPL